MSSDGDSPAADPPPGIEPNFDHPSNRNGLIIGLVTFCLCLSMLFIFIRVYAKFIYAKKAQVQDYLLIPAIVCYLGFCAVAYRTSVTTGHYVHLWDYRLSGLSLHYYETFLTVQFYLATMMILKPVILLEWVHIFVPGQRNAFYWTCYIVAVVNFIYYAINIILENVSCTPRERYWDKTVPGSCWNASILSGVSAIINLIFDLIMVALPQGIIWRLNMSRKKRFGVSLVFIMGLIALGCAAGRIGSALSYIESTDTTYNLSTLGIWCLAEMTAGFMVLAMPAAPKPVAHLAQQATESMRGLLSTRGSADGSSPGQSRGYSRKQSRTQLYMEVEGHVQIPLAKTGSAKTGSATPRSKRSVQNVRGKQSSDSEAGIILNN